jgi:hypothetical protein
MMRLSVKLLHCYKKELSYAQLLFNLTDLSESNIIVVSNFSHVTEQFNCVKCSKNNGRSRVKLNTSKVIGPCLGLAHLLTDCIYR